MKSFYTFFADEKKINTSAKTLISMVQLFINYKSLHNHPENISLLRQYVITSRWFVYAVYIGYQEKKITKTRSTCHQPEATYITILADKSKHNKVKHTQSHSLHDLYG